MSKNDQTGKRIRMRFLAALLTLLLCLGMPLSALAAEAGAVPEVSAGAGQEETVLTDESAGGTDTVTAAEGGGSVPAGGEAASENDDTDPADGSATAEDENGPVVILEPEDGDVPAEDPADAASADPDDLLEDETMETAGGTHLPGELYLLEEETDWDAGYFTVVMAPPELAEEPYMVQFPTWSASGGQDDLVWYQAAKQTDGSYKLRVDLKKHQFVTGFYNVHSYAVSKDRVKTKISSLKVTVPFAKGEIAAEQQSEYKYRIRLSGLSVPGGVKKVEFPVWSTTNGQDDLKWYQGVRQADGSYEVSINLQNHKHLGKFSVHVYATNALGKKVCLQTTSVSTRLPKGGSISVVPGTFNYDNGTFTVRMTGLTNTDLAKNTRFAVWQASDQSDIKWYAATKKSDGSYTANIDIRNHKCHAGMYNVHAYVTDTRGDNRFQSKLKQEFAVKIGSFTIDESTDGEMTFAAHAKDVQVPLGVKGVSFAVWSKTGGQDDLKWYTDSTPDSQGRYDAKIKILNHKTAGKYYVHAYAVTSNGAKVFLKDGTFTVSGSSGTVSAPQSVANKGKFKITGSGISTPSGVSMVQFAVWQADDQSDICWYTAEADGSGGYQATADVSKHKHHSGEYKIHMYVTGKNGARSRTAGTRVTISLQNYIYATPLNSYRSYYEVAVVNPTVGGKTPTVVQVPTWSITGDQDDLKWYTATNQGNNVWTAKIFSANHKHAGQFVSHVYVTVDGQRTFLGSTKYTVNSYSMAKLVDFCYSKLGVAYVYGMWGQVLTEARYWELRNLYGSSMVWDSDIKKVGKVCTDCSGLISWFTGVRLTSTNYFNTAVKKVPIKDLNETMVGWALWMPGHIGIYVGDGYYIAADGSAFGVRKAKVSNQAWQYAIKLGGFEK